MPIKRPEGIFQMQNPVEMVLIGAGNRGRGIFGQYALNMPHRAKFVALISGDRRHVLTPVRESLDGHL
ncbi:MAG: hypothetical protein ABR497_03480, partial [Kiritimatiellia bacterium]